MAAAARIQELRRSFWGAVERITSPIVYLAVLGGMQVGLLWVLRAHFGLWLPAAGTLGYALLLGALQVVRGRWNVKLCALTGLVALTAIGPTVSNIVTRPAVGFAMEHDGLVQTEIAIDRVLHRLPIYGVDWSDTPLASMPWDMTAGSNPALHHHAYFPLVTLAGVPVRLLADAAGTRFDYRMVLILFALMGLVAVATLPITRERRFMVMTALYMSPLITLYLWAGRNDIEFLSMLFVSLALLARGHPRLAGAALGVAVAFKPFAWFAVPFFVLVLFIRWRQRRSTAEIVVGLAGLSLVPVATVLPFVIANPSAFWTDIVLYTSGGVPDAYPIAGYGFGEFLYQQHLVARRTDSFPFGLVQLLVTAPTLWLMARAFLRRPTISRWMGGYALVLLAFTYFARFFNDNYFGVVATLGLCVLPLGFTALTLPAAEPADRLAA
jgi:glycosyl transferase family 87